MIAGEQPSSDKAHEGTHMRVHTRTPTNTHMRTR